MGTISPSTVEWNWDEVRFDEYYASIPGTTDAGKDVVLKFRRSHIESADGTIVWED